MDTGWDTDADDTLAAVLEPIARLAVEIFEPCTAAVIDVVEAHPVPPLCPAATLTVATDERLVDLHTTVYELGEGPAPAALRTHQTVVDELPSRLGCRWDLLADDAGLTSALSHPLVDEDAPSGPLVVGVLTLYGTQRPGVRALDRNAVALLASVICTMIVHAGDPERFHDIVSLDQLVLDLGPSEEIDIREPTQEGSTAP